jgi:DsbC/DsbD-like thiol-disulfide interchange protein
MARNTLMVGLGLALAALVVGFVAQVGSAGGKLDPVKVAASAGKSSDDAKQAVVIQVKIDKGWHIYANPAENEEVAQAQTTVTIKASGKPVAASVKYPAGRLYKEPGMGAMKIYEDEVTIQAELAKTDGPLEVSVKFQACDAKRCLLPKTVKITLP